MDRPDEKLLDAFVARRIDTAEDASRVADATAAAWEDIVRALQPVLGMGGVLGLYRRSLHLAADEHPWLESGDSGDKPGHANPDGLRAALAQRSTIEARAAAARFVRCFDELLSSLVGPTLTTRLLRPVWTGAIGHLNEQEERP